MPNSRPQRLSESIYQTLKTQIWRFALMPGDRFSEGEVAARLHVSRTPVRQALQRLEREGYVQVHFKSGWQVRLLDAAEMDDLYDVRMVLERAAIEKLCSQSCAQGVAAIQDLCAIWCVPEAQRLTDGAVVADLDEAFHNALVAATGNREMARMHQHISERIRILRRLDFTEPHRIALTYQEHQQILAKIVKSQSQDAQLLLTRHIQASKAQVRSLTLNRLAQARAPVQATGT